MRWTTHTNPLSATSVDCMIASVQSFLARMGLQRYDHLASLWIFFAACGVTELCISFLICTPLERFRPLTSWPKRNPIAADVTYALFVRIILFPLIAYFEYNWLHVTLSGGGDADGRSGNDDAEEVRAVSCEAAGFSLDPSRRLMRMVSIPPLAPRAIAGRAERCSSRSESARA